VLELARRALAQQLADKPVFDAPQSLLDFVRLHIGSKPYEVFAVMFLDSQQKLIAWEEIFRGSLAEAKVYPRDVAVRALHHHAASVILAHNHPSGDLRISKADEALTELMRSALQLLDIRLIDHIITTRDQAIAMSNQGLL
jgi:DNA repair protein RadC